MRNIILLIVMLCTWTSCDLDLQSENALNYSNAFATESELNTTTSSILFYLNSFFSENLVPIMAGAVADEMSQENLDYRNGNPYVISSANPDWAMLYNVIFESNLLLDNIGNTKGLSEERYNFHCGQANFAMGLAYFALAQRYGDCVITNNSSDLVMYSTSPMLEVIDKAIQCARRGYEQLPVFEQLKGMNGTSVTSKQYACKGTCAALLAHLYAWKGSVIELYKLDGNSQEAYGKSVEYASLLIDRKAGNYSLCSTPEELCTHLSIRGDNNPEAIFTFPFDVARSEYTVTPNVVGTYYVSWPVDQFQTEGDLAFTPSLRIYKQTVSEMYPDETDARRSAFFYEWDEQHVVEGDHGEQDYAIMYKFRKGLISQDQSSTGGGYFRSLDADYVYWRLADIILLRAECYAKLNQTGPAEKDLNTIRNRSEAVEYPSGHDTNLQLAIFKEREREFIGENDGRYFDIMRNNYIKTELQGYFIELTWSDIQGGALFLPIPIGAYKDSSSGLIINTNIRQKSYWHKFIK